MAESFSLIFYYLQVSREVGAREKELTHQVHREILVRCLDQVKNLAPILICSMKIFIHIISQGELVSCLNELDIFQMFRRGDLSRVW